jgi:DNA-binding MarR family transcriptional regulator
MRIQEQDSGSQNTDNDHCIKLENQVCFPLYSAANAVIRAYRPLLNKLDLTYPQYLVMMVLWEDNNLSVKEIGDKLLLDSGTLTPLLKRLENKGVLTRLRNEKDERARVISLTPAGIAMKFDARKVPETLMCRVNMRSDELHSLKALCEQLIAELN